MGKPKRKTARGLRGRGKRAEPAAKRGEYTIDQLLEKAEEVLDQYNYELGMKFCQRALEMDSDHPKALTMTASLFMETGDVENAKRCLGRAITVQPDEDHAKYLTMAQLMAGREALALYLKGIDIAGEKLRTLSDDAESRAELRRELSNALCAVAELFMTDLCDENEAESSCSENIQKAIEADTENPEAFQTQARFLLIKESFEESKAAIQKSLSLWLPRYQSILENDESTASDPVEVCPLLYTTRIATAKILIELDMFDEASQVLEGLLEEDDEIVETWYLLGWLNSLRAKDGVSGYNSNARFYLDKAARVHKTNPTDDMQMVNHIEELLAELGPEDAQEDGAESGDDNDDWEDVQSSEDEMEVDACVKNKS